ncbi:hypothetical protein COCCU_05475 [Corynebacterium occultum]|uniref:Uncharacterized protein n=1 Tax=Corynebacterium occultum TaxID=2675219 RepID=A0A6B8W3D9_9CORY|nr:hypothetical protein COCCU_05475 [Corynebacterium occultum]
MSGVMVGAPHAMPGYRVAYSGQKFENENSINKILSPRSHIGMLSLTMLSTSGWPIPLLNDRHTDFAAFVSGSAGEIPYGNVPALHLVEQVSFQCPQGSSVFQGLVVDSTLV